MSITALSVLVDGTVAASGGTATTIVSKGDSDLSHKVILDDGEEFLTQTAINFTVKEPKIDASAPNGYTQARNTVFFTVPLVLDNGNRTVNTGKIELAFDIETTDAEKLTLRSLLAQSIIDGDLDDFYNKQSVS